MDTTFNIEQIVSQIEKLDYNSKINILGRLVNLLKRERNVIQPSSITSLKGLGKDVWQKIDTTSYISAERESWD